LSYRPLKLHRFFFQAEDGIRVFHVTGVQTCALPIWATRDPAPRRSDASRDGFGPSPAEQAGATRATESPVPAAPPAAPARARARPPRCRSGRTPPVRGLRRR